MTINIYVVSGQELFNVKQYPHLNKKVFTKVVELSELRELLEEKKKQAQAKANIHESVWNKEKFADALTGQYIEVGKERLCWELLAELDEKVK